MVRAARSNRCTRSASLTQCRHGESAVHSHMTNTRITDAEILEKRYPVLVKEFSVRKGYDLRALTSASSVIWRKETQLARAAPVGRVGTAVVMG